MCIDLRLEKASKANTRKSEYLERRKESTKVAVLLTTIF
jgi:hypothetical protein